MIRYNWTKQQQAQFLKRLGDLIVKGYSLSQGIEFLQIHENKRHQHDLNICLESLKEGELLYQALEKLKFKKDVLAYLYFANMHGDLSGALMEAYSMLTKQVEYQDKFVKIIKYPLFLFVFVSVMVYMIQTILVPQFDMLFVSMGGSKLLPSYLSSFFNIGKITFYGCVGIGCLLLVYYLLFFRRFSPIAKIKLFASLPFLQSFIRLLISHYFSVQLSSLLKGGLSIYQALQVFESTPYMPFYQWEARKIKQQLAQGESLQSIILSRVYFEPELAVIISHGQTNGEIARELYDYSQYALERLENKVVKILGMIQPLLFSSIGVTVILMYLAMLLPMLNMINTI